VSGLLKRRKKHHPECPETDPFETDFCRCVELEDQLVQSYVPKRASLSDPQGPYQSLASLIRAARRDGLLKPIQQYGGGHAPASVP
jgi:hypothetical protein